MVPNHQPDIYPRKHQFEKLPQLPRVLEANEQLIFGPHVFHKAAVPATLWTKESNLW